MHYAFIIIRKVHLLCIFDLKDLVKLEKLILAKKLKTECSNTRGNRFVEAEIYVCPRQKLLHVRFKILCNEIHWANSTHKVLQL